MRLPLMVIDLIVGFIVISIYISLIQLGHVLIADTFAILNILFLTTKLIDWYNKKLRKK